MQTTNAFQVLSNTRVDVRTALFAKRPASDTAVVPPLKRHSSRKICLMVEPTPFTHVSGYANRFKEMLKFLKKAGDEVDILTVDSKTPVKDLPRQYKGFPVHHTLGFTFPLYNHISLTFDLPEMKGARIIENFKPDLIHVTSPGFLLFAALFYARVMKIPLVMSYHTHLPTYGTLHSGAPSATILETVCLTYTQNLFSFPTTQAGIILGSYLAWREHAGTCCDTRTVVQI